MVLRTKIDFRAYSWKYLLAFVCALFFVVANLLGSYSFGKKIMVGFTVDTDAQPPRGILVSEVESGYPAERGGLRPHDLIESVNGIPMLSIDDYDKVFSGLHEGMTVTFH